jgi:hypothetical protein
MAAGTMSRINIGGRKVNVPDHPVLRKGLAILLIIGGFLGFLPILGFWMLPLGLAILAIDFPPLRRLQRRMTISFGYWLHRKWPKFARHFGYGTPRNGKH